MACFGSITIISPGEDGAYCMGCVVFGPCRVLMQIASHCEYIVFSCYSMFWHVHYVEACGIDAGMCLKISLDALSFMALVIMLESKSKAQNGFFDFDTGIRSHT